MSLLHGNRLRPARLVRAGRIFVLSLLMILVARSAPAEEIVVHEFSPARYADVRIALLDALIDEGLAPPAVSHFGAMLHRAAPQLGHAPDLYEEAEIFSFCSVKISALLAQEDRRNIALCPLTIALYSVPTRPKVVFLSYRAPQGAAAAAPLARQLLDRIADRSLRNTGLRP